MRDETKPHVVETPDQDPRGEDSSWTDTCSSETVQAVAPNEVTAGLEVTPHDSTSSNVSSSASLSISPSAFRSTVAM